MTDYTEPGLDTAVIGLTCRFPDANTADGFWAMLRDGREAIARFTPEQLRARGVPAAVLSDPDFVPAGGFLEGVELFDAEFFGYSPREAQLTDPQHRLFLECAWEAMEDAGYVAEHFDGQVGVFGGSTMNTYLSAVVLQQRKSLDFISDQQLMIGNDKDFLTTRVTHKLNLTGVCYTVQSACATSLVAIHAACRSLLSGECDLALAGAASIHVPQGTGYIYQEGGTSSPDGHCRAFDARAAGSVVGSGVGVVALRRLADAIAAGDHILGVIKGTAVTSDGAAKAGFAAPTVHGQVRAITEALAVAGVSADSIGYVEAHGTGTSLGDPIEMAALTQAFRARGAVQRASIPIGSVKTNIGHLDAAAGMASLVKVLLAMRYGQIPASLHFERPNPEIDFHETPFFVNTQLREWPATTVPRRALINSIGMGGTNAALILEEPPRQPTRAPSSRAQILPLSARTPSALSAQAARLRAFLQAHPHVEIADVAWTLQSGRRALECRRAVVCHSSNEAAVLLGEQAPPRHPVADAPKLLFLLPGQGAQYPGMGAQLYEREPVFRDVVRHAAELLRPRLGEDLTAVMYRGGESADAALRRTAIAQSALFVTEYALARLLASWGITPDAMLGHSVGELVAACLAEVFTFEDALQIVAERGRSMEAMPPGRMLAVQLSAEELQSLLTDDIEIASVNAPRQCVVSGPSAAIEALQAVLDERNVLNKPLNVSHAFHSAMMEPAAAALADVLARIRLASPKVPFLATVTGDWIRPEEATDIAYWTGQIRRPVRFRDALARAAGTGPYQALEVGPGRKLSQLLLQCSQPAEAAELEPLPCMGDRCDAQAEHAVLLAVVARLWERGTRAAWAGLHGDECRRRVSLPTYPFERKRHWLDPEPAPEAATTASSAAATTVLDARGGGGLNAVITVTRERIVITTSSSLMAERADNAPAPHESAQPSRPAAPVAPTARANGATIESQVAEMVEQLLGVRDVDRDIDLLRLGADSLLLTQLLSRLRRTFRVVLSMREVLEARSVSQIAVRIERARAPSAPTAAEPRPPGDDAPQIEALLDGIEHLSPDEVKDVLADATRAPGPMHE